MARGPYRGGTLTRTALGGAAACLVLALAACGSEAGGGQTAGAVHTGARSSPAPTVTVSSSVALCAATGQVDTVVATPESSLPTFGHVPKPQLRAVTVRNPAKVRALAAAACALPAAVMGPVDPEWGGYELVFASATRSFPPVYAETTASRTVTGLGPPRTARASFSHLLSATLAAG